MKFFDPSSPIVRGIVIGAVLGAVLGFQGGETPQLAGVGGAPANQMVYWIVPVFVILPPLLAFLQRSRLRRSDPTWLSKAMVHVNLNFLMAFLLIFTFLGHVFAQGSVYPRDLGLGTLFFGALGMGWLLTALIDMRWGMAAVIRTSLSQPGGTGTARSSSRFPDISQGESDEAGRKSVRSDESHKALSPGGKATPPVVNGFGFSVGLRLAAKSLRYGLADLRWGVVVLGLGLVFVFVVSSALPEAVSIVARFPVLFVLMLSVFAVFCVRCEAVQEGQSFNLSTVPRQSWINCLGPLVLFAAPIVLALATAPDLPGKPHWAAGLQLIVLTAGWTALPYAVLDKEQGRRAVRASILTLKRYSGPVIVVVMATVVLPWACWYTLIFTVGKQITASLPIELSVLPFVAGLVVSVILMVLGLHASVATYRFVTGRLVLEET